MIRYIHELSGFIGFVEFIEFIEFIRFVGWDLFNVQGSLFSDQILQQCLTLWKLLPSEPDP